MIGHAYELIERFNALVRDTDDPFATQIRMAGAGPPSLRDNVQELLGYIQALELGLIWDEG